MKACFSILFSIFLFLFPLFSRQDVSSGVQTYLIQEDRDILISIETYKQNRGWTPVIINLDSLEIKMWMDVTGRVTEKYGHGSYLVRPLFIIDFEKCEMTIEKNILPFHIEQHNEVRTRIRIPDVNILLSLKIDRVRSLATLNLGKEKIIVRQIRVDFFELEKGIYELKLRGLNLRMRNQLVLFEESGEMYTINSIIYTTQLEKSKIWAKREYEVN